MAEVGGVCAVVEDSSGGDIVLAFVYTSAAGLSTVLGGMIPFFFVNEKRWLGAGLGFAAGVMVYLSFVEILTKSHAYFVCVAGDDGAAWRTSLCFFSGTRVRVRVRLCACAFYDMCGCVSRYARNVDCAGLVTCVTQAGGPPGEGHLAFWRYAQAFCFSFFTLKTGMLRMLCDLVECRQDADGQGHPDVREYRN
jgi:hypothetical protein